MMNASMSRMSPATGRCLFASVAVVALSAAAYCADAPKPIAHWKMDAMKDGKIADVSGNGRDLKVGADCRISSHPYGKTRKMPSLYLPGTKGSWAAFDCPALENFTVTVVGETATSVMPVDGGSINILQVIAASGGTEEKASGALTLSSEAFACGDFSVPTASLSGLALHGRRALVFAVGQTYYELIIPEGYSVLKFVEYYSSLQEV